MGTRDAAANDTDNKPSLPSTLPILALVTPIANYPTKLPIFKTHASRYWQVCCFLKGSTHTQSLKTTNKQAAISQAKQWGKPVLVVHGDSHHFRFDQPFSTDKNRISNVTRLIVPDASDVRAVRVLVTSEVNFQFELLAP